VQRSVVGEDLDPAEAVDLGAGLHFDCSSEAVVWSSQAEPRLRHICRGCPGHHYLPAGVFAELQVNLLGWGGAARV